MQKPRLLIFVICYVMHHVFKRWVIRTQRDWSQNLVPVSDYSTNFKTTSVTVMICMFTLVYSMHSRDLDTDHYCSNLMFIFIAVYCSTSCMLAWIACRFTKHKYTEIKTLKDLNKIEKMMKVVKIPKTLTHLILFHCRKDKCWIWVCFKSKSFHVFFVLVF